MPRGVAVVFVLLALASPADATDDPRARALYGEVIAPCCWSQPVSVHQSPAAEEVRAFIRGRVADGWSDQRIKDALATRYGAAVLARPPARGFTWALYVTPWVTLAGSAAALWWVLRRVARRVTPDGLSTGSPPELDERLQEALRELD